MMMATTERTLTCTPSEVSFVEKHEATAILERATRPWSGRWGLVRLFPTLQ